MDKYIARAQNALARHFLLIGPWMGSTHVVKASSLAFVMTPRMRWRTAPTTLRLQQMMQASVQ